MMAFNSPRFDEKPAPRPPAYIETRHTRRQERVEEPKVTRTRSGVRFIITGTAIEMRADAATALRDALTAALNPAEVQS